MKTYFVVLLTTLCLWLASSAFAASLLTEDQKIDKLIHSIEVLPGAQFIRNGSTYDGKAAADHLRTKRRFAGSRIKTADQFIDCCATGSSMSGEPYKIRFTNGETMDSATFFRAELKRIEGATPAQPIHAPG